MAEEIKNTAPKEEKPSSAKKIQVKTVKAKTAASEEKAQAKTSGEKTESSHTSQAHTPSDAQHSNSAPTGGMKRLFRSQQGAIVGGVAAGLGEYFEIDPAIIRLLFVLSTFFGGFGIPVYLVLWIILPEKSAGEAGSEETIKRNLQELKDKTQSFTQNISTNSTTGNSRSTFALILIVLGVVFLMDQMHLIRFDLFWPLILIVIGLAIWMKK